VQAIDRTQRLPPRADHDIVAHADPKRGDIACVESEIERDVVDDREQGVAVTLDPGRT